MKKIPFAIWLLFIGLIPVFLFFKQDTMKRLLEIDNDKFVDVILVAIPFVFSAIMIIVNYRLDYVKEQKESKINAINKENTLIRNYNMILVKTLANYNNLMNELNLIIKTFERLKNNPILFEVINLWESETKKVIDLSNENKFREFIRAKLSDLIQIYKADNIFDSDLEYLNNLEQIFCEYHVFTLDEKIFIYSLRNYISFSEKEKKIIQTYLDLFSLGDVFNRICDEFKTTIQDYHSCFEGEVRQKKIDNRKLFNLLYKLTNKTFHYTETLLCEVFFMKQFMDVIIKEFDNYYESKYKTYKVLDEHVKIEDLSENVFIEKYVDQNVVYNYYFIPDDKVKK
jgi:hypothetical protein